MFRNSNRVDRQIGKVDSQTISSIVDHNMIITGDARFQGKARIGGTVNGDITGDHPILSQSGSTQGDINVVSFLCHGAVEGSLPASLIAACKGCSIRGNLEAENLIVGPGTSLEGEVVTARDSGTATDVTTACAEEGSRT